MRIRLSSTPTRCSGPKEGGLDTYWRYAIQAIIVAIALFFGFDLFKPVIAGTRSPLEVGFMLYNFWFLSVRERSGIKVETKISFSWETKNIIIFDDAMSIKLLRCVLLENLIFYPSINSVSFPNPSSHRIGFIRENNSILYGSRRRIIHNVAMRQWIRQEINDPIHIEIVGRRHAVINERKFNPNGPIFLNTNHSLERYLVNADIGTQLTNFVIASGQPLLACVISGESGSY